MATSLSEDLRIRVIEAVKAGAPGRQGGDRKSRRIEAEAEFLLAQVEETPDDTLVELQARLRDELCPNLGDAA